MATFGKVREVAVELEWQIDDFFALPEKEGDYCTSPSFSFAEESWYFTIYPNGRSKHNAVGYVEAYLHRKLEGPPISLAWSLEVKTFGGKRDHEMQLTYVFEKAEGYGSPKFLKRSDLSEKKSELVPSDVLILVCHIDYYSKSSDDAGNIVTAKCSHCKTSFDAEYVPSHEEKCLDKPMRCPTCGNVVALRKWFDHECDTARVKATEKLVDDLAVILESEEHSDVTISVKDKQFQLHRSILAGRNPYFSSMFKTEMKEKTTGIVSIDGSTEKLMGDLAHILESEEHSDVTIIVKDKEFQLHRSILAGRNPYFSSMFKTEMKEKTTGIVSIDDCEPGIFQSFIYFIYTGKVHTLSCDNVCALYEVADKYQEGQLKAECLCYMKNEISMDSFVDFIVVALKHDEKELLLKATDLYCRKAKEIVQSVKWQTFMREYPTQANELYIKALNYYVK